MKYSLHILKNKNLSKRPNILPQMHWTSNIFGHSATTIGVFWVSLNYPVLNFKKTVCPKNVWMWHWLQFTFNWWALSLFLHFMYFCNVFLKVLQIFNICRHSGQSILLVKMLSTSRFSSKLLSFTFFCCFPLSDWSVRLVAWSD